VRDTGPETGADEAEAHQTSAITRKRTMASMLRRAAARRKV
jgi:hypothetical protein